MLTGGLGTRQEQMEPPPILVALWALGKILGGDGPICPPPPFGDSLKRVLGG